MHVWLRSPISQRCQELWRCADLECGAGSRGPCTSTRVWISPLSWCLPVSSPISGHGTSGPPEGVEGLLEVGPNEEITQQEASTPGSTPRNPMKNTSWGCVLCLVAASRNGLCWRRVEAGSLGRAWSCLRVVSIEWGGGLLGTLRKASSFPSKVYSPTCFHLYLHILPKWCSFMVIGEACPLNVPSCPYSFPSETSGVGAGEFSGCGCSVFASPVISLCCWVAKWCPTLCDPVDLQPARLLCPWDFQAGILERAAISFPGCLSDPGIKSSSLALAGGFFTTEPITLLMHFILDGSLSRLWPYNWETAGIHWVYHTDCTPIHVYTHNWKAVSEERKEKSN